MSEQEVTYSTVKFHKSSGLQNQVRPEETQGPKETGHRECSAPWNLIVVAFGILCSLLLVTVAVLVTNLFQYSQEKLELQETLNHHHNCSAMKGDIDLKEETMRNKTTDCSLGGEILESLLREQNKWYRETNAVVNSNKNAEKGVETHWFCYGIKCYYFIKDNMKWSGCNQTCQNSRLSLLKIDDEDELKFLRLQINPVSHWIGLSYDNKIKNWTWIDNGSSKLDFKIGKLNFKNGKCVFLTKARLEKDKCENRYSCICEKRLDKFPD